MGIGISKAAAELWKASDRASYDEYFLEEVGDYAYFTELPDWAYSATEGPFYIEADGSIYSISIRVSQDGELIGNTTDF